MKAFTWGYRVALVLFDVQGPVSAEPDTLGGIVGKGPTVLGPEHWVFCQTGEDAWRRVIQYDPKGVLTSTRRFSFNEIWNLDRTSSLSSEEETEAFPWSDLLLPLPDADIQTWGYALL